MTPGSELHEAINTAVHDQITEAVRPLLQRIATLEQRANDNYADKTQLRRRLDQLEQVANLEEPPERYTITPEQHRKLLAFEAMERLGLDVLRRHELRRWESRWIGKDLNIVSDKKYSLAEAIEDIVRKIEGEAC